MPDASLAEEWAAKAAMGEEELAAVIRSTADLKRAQLAEDSAEDLATIPRVGLVDLEAKVCLSRVTAYESILGRTHTPLGKRNTSKEVIQDPLPSHW